jgi:hypothetical protein
MQNTVNKIVYTGFVKTSDPHYQYLDKWKINALYKMQKFADSNNADLKVMGDDGFFYFYDQMVKSGCCGWIAATLTSVWAINEFAKSKYEEMLWLDLDCVPSIYAEWPQENIWMEKFKQEHVFEDEFSNKKSKFFWDYVVPRMGPVEYFAKTKSCMFSLRKDTAQRMIDLLTIKGLNPLENTSLHIPDESFLEAFFSYNPPKTTEPLFDDYPKLTGKLFTHYGHHREKIC